MKKSKPIFLALLAAVFYAISVPFSKLLLEHVAPTMQAAFLYLGAGFGISLFSLFRRKDRQQEEKLNEAICPMSSG